MMGSITEKRGRGEKINWTERARARHKAIDSPSALKSLMHQVMHDYKHGNVRYKGGRRQAIAVGLALQSKRRAKGAAERRLTRAIVAKAESVLARALPSGGDRGAAARKAWLTRRGGVAASAAASRQSSFSPRGTGWTK